MNTISVQTIFQPTPTQWGLRGDPYLWKDLEEYFLQHPLPRDLSEKQFVDQIHQAIIELTGHSTEAGEDFFAPKYDTKGMSSGTISARFWEETAIPLLVGRFRSLYDSSYF